MCLVGMNDPPEKKAFKTKAIHQAKGVEILIEL